MTATMDPKSTARKQDPIEAEARRIVERWKADADAKQYARAYQLAHRQASEAALIAHDAKPESWALRFRKAGVTGLAIVWPGAPVDPSTCLRPGPWEIDEIGVWIQLEAQPRQLVCSPVVATGRGGPYAALVNGKWKAVARPAAAQRGISARQHADLVMKALAGAGVQFGPEITSGFRSDALDHRPASVYASIWLMGIDPVSDSIGNCPVIRLTDLRPAAEDSRPAGGEARQQLGEVLGRQPLDVHSRRGRR